MSSLARVLLPRCAGPRRTGACVAACCFSGARGRMHLPLAPRLWTLMKLQLVLLRFDLGQVVRRRRIQHDSHVAGTCVPVDISPFLRHTTRGCCLSQALTFFLARRGIAGGGSRCGWCDEQQCGVGCRRRTRTRSTSRPSTTAPRLRCGRGSRTRALWTEAGQTTNAVLATAAVVVPARPPARLVPHSSCLVAAFPLVI